MTWIEALILGIIQGLTEFLPVSSSGHLEIGAALLGTHHADHLLFAVMVHLGTALATIVIFRKDIYLISIEVIKFRWNESTQFVLKIICSMIPIFVVALFFKEEIDAVFTGNVVFVGNMLVITSVLLTIAYLRKDGESAVSFVSAFIIGIAQAFAVLPGISRSGITIATGLILGIEKSKATRFSFLMVLIPIIGAGLIELRNYFSEPLEHPVSGAVLIIGFVSALVTGFLACKWMIAIVKHGKLAFFAAYCFIVGFITIFVSIQ